MLASDVLHPVGHSCREQRDLQVLFVACLTSLLEDVVDVLLEAELEHDVCFVEHESLQLREVDVASLNVIFDTARGANEKIDTTLQLVGLVHDAHAAIDRHDPELLGRMLHLCQLVRDLDGELSRRRQHDSLHLARAKQLVLSEPLDERQAEGERLSGAREIARNDVLTVPDGIEAVLLDGEEILVALGSQIDHRLLWYLRELVVGTINGRIGSAAADLGCVGLATRQILHVSLLDI